VTVDCLDPQRVAGFWGALPGREPGPSRDGRVCLGDHGDALPWLAFQPVPEPGAGKVRIHLDVAVGEHRARHGLGGQSAGERHDYDEGIVVVVADPEGHEFCLVQYH
jgi:hypothetical protein